jgi:hypothetical protein
MVFVIEASLVLLLLLLSLSLSSESESVVALFVSGDHFLIQQKCVSRIFILYDSGFRFALLFGNFDLEILDAKDSQLTLISLPIVSVNGVGSCTLFCSYHCFCFCTDHFPFFFPSESLLLSVTLVSSVCWNTLLCS